MKQKDEQALGYSGENANQYQMILGNELYVLTLNNLHENSYIPIKTKPGIILYFKRITDMVDWSDELDMDEIYDNYYTFEYMWTKNPREENIFNRRTPSYIHDTKMVPYAIPIDSFTTKFFMKYINAIYKKIDESDNYYSINSNQDYLHNLIEYSPNFLIFLTEHPPPLEFIHLNNPKQIDQYVIWYVVDSRTSRNIGRAVLGGSYIHRYCDMQIVLFGNPAEEIAFVDTTNSPYMRKYQNLPLVTTNMFPNSSMYSLFLNKSRKTRRRSRKRKSRKTRRRSRKTKKVF